MPLPLVYRQDAGGVERSQRATRELRNKAIEEWLFLVAQLERHGPDADSRCNNLLDIPYGIFAQRIQRTRRSFFLFLLDENSPRLIMLGIDHNGRGCGAAQREATIAHRDGGLE